MWKVTAAEVKTTAGVRLTIPGSKQKKRSLLPCLALQPPASNASKVPMTKQKCGLQSPSLSTSGKIGFKTEGDHLITRTMAFRTYRSSLSLHSSTCVMGGSASLPGLGKDKGVVNTDCPASGLTVALYLCSLHPVFSLNPAVGG